MNSEDFKLLSLREENKLTPSQLSEYYRQLREYLQSRKLQTTTPGALTVAPRLKKYVNKLDYAVTKLLSGGPVEQITDGTENIPDGAVLFANNHQGVIDNLCWILGNPRHAVMLHGADTSPVLIWAQLCTGLVLVDKNNPDSKQNRTDAKLDMIQILRKGHCIWYFPEGTWNLSPNKLHLPMSFGFLEVAKKAGVPVVPVATQMTYDTSSEKLRITKIHIRYGKPIHVGIQDDLAEKLEEYCAALSTLRWELMEENGIVSRREVSHRDYINYLKGSIRMLGMKNPKLGGKKMLEIERSSIRGAGEERYLFQHINDIPFDETDTLKLPPEVLRLELLYNTMNTGRNEFMSINDTIARINELAKKAKTEGLTAEELQERDKLRRIYIDSVKANLVGQLDNTYIVDQKGNKTPLKKK